MQTTPFMSPLKNEPAPCCQLAEQGDPHYTIFSDLIASTFKKAYNARVMVSYPTLIGVCGKDGNPQAALGLRGAEEEPLFLERYLDMPAQEVIARRIGLTLSRHEIAEAGNLASTRTAALRDIMFALSLTLKQQGFRYILFTGTESLKNYLEALGLKPVIYAEANPARLGEEAHHWGSYYDMKPKVMGGTTDAFYEGLLTAYRRRDKSS